MLSRLFELWSRLSEVDASRILLSIASFRFAASMRDDRTAISFLNSSASSKDITS